MIFDFFKKRDYTNVVKFPTTVPESIPPYVAPESVAKSAECHYTVGTDGDGKVVLRVGGNGYATTTLTMNEDATRHLIRMLEAAMFVEDDEDAE